MTLRIAELSAPGRGGVAVLAVEGGAARERLARLIAAPLPAPGSFRIVRLVSGGELLDEALCLARGAEAFELHLHGSPLLVRRISLLLGPADPEPLPATVEERARSLLARAPCEAAARLLLDQAEGAWRREAETLDPADPGLAARLAELERRARVARRLCVPPVVLLAGPANAGKSTLFNALVGEERVVVSSEPGTTRDLVSEPALCGAYAIQLVDGAGERETAHLEDAGRAGSERAALERAGQRLSRAARERADLLLWLEPARELATAPARGARGPGAHGPGGAPGGAPGRAPGRAPGGGVAPDGGPASVVLASQADRLVPEATAVLENAFSALADPAGARALVERVFHAALDLPRDPWRSGAGVPFDEPLRRAVARLRAALERGAPEPELRALREELL